jgi:hypothetical protein
MQTILCVVTVVFQLCLTTVGNCFAWQMLGPRDEVSPGRKKSLDVVWWSILLLSHCMPILPEISLPELTVFNAENRSFTTQTIYRIQSQIRFWD